MSIRVRVCTLLIVAQIVALVGSVYLVLYRSVRPPPRRPTLSLGQCRALVGVGDILLVRSPTIEGFVISCLSASWYTHVAIVLSSGEPQILDCCCRGIRVIGLAEWWNHYDIPGSVIAWRKLHACRSNGTVDARGLPASTFDRFVQRLAEREYPSMLEMIMSRAMRRPLSTLRRNCTDTVTELLTCSGVLSPEVCFALCTPDSFRQGALLDSALTPGVFLGREFHIVEGDEESSDVEGTRGDGTPMAPLIPVPDA